MLDKHKLNTKSFKKGNNPWNKGTKGVMKAWNKGIKTESNGVLEKYVKENGSWNKGKKNWMVPPLKGKLNQKISKEKHWNWKGGITEENRLFRNSGPYRKWRMDVFQRDRFTCILCGYRSHKKRDIRADHIKPFSLFPELRLDVSNGRTLCLPCDLKYGWNYLRYRGVKKNEK